MEGRIKCWQNHGLSLKQKKGHEEWLAVGKKQDAEISN